MGLLFWIPLVKVPKPRPVCSTFNGRQVSDSRRLLGELCGRRETLPNGVFGNQQVEIVLLDLELEQCILEVSSGLSLQETLRAKQAMQQAGRGLCKSLIPGFRANLSVQGPP